MTEYTNLKIHDITVSDRNNQYILTVVEPYMLDPSASIKHDITLWSRRDGTISPDDIERTQSRLREELGDDAIIFTDPTQASDDPNHIVQWIKNHPDAKVAHLHQYNGYVNLGKPYTGGSNNKFLDMYKPDEHGEYNPDKHRVSVYDAWPERVREYYQNGEGPGVRESSKKNKTLYHDAIARRVIFDDANAFEEKTQNMTRRQFKDDILEILDGVDAFEEIVSDLESLDDDASFADMVEILGGREFTNLESNRRKQKAAAGVLDIADRKTLAVYLQNPDTGYMFRSTRTYLPREADMYTYAWGFEFLTGDFCPADFNQLLQIFVKSPDSGGLGMQQQDIAEDLKSAGFFQDNQLDIETEEDALKALNAIFKDRTVNIATGIANKAGKKKISQLGARLNQVSGREDIEVAEPEVLADSTREEITLDDIPDAPAPAPKAKAPETNPLDTNPF